MYKNVVLIIIASFFLSSSINDFGMMFLSIPSFLIISYNLSDILLKAIKKKNSTYKKNKNFELIALIGVSSTLFVIRDFGQTIGGYFLFWKLAFISLLFSLSCILLLNHFYNFEDDKKNYSILGISICFFLLVPNIGVFINKNYSIENEKETTLLIQNKTISKSSRGEKTYSIFINYKKYKNERLDVNENLYDEINYNEFITLTIRKGIFGYDYVQNIKIE